ncbi:DUF2961 domain-containing protein [Cohnella thailandensis]|uniref:DUF2961 domain-containing protein n=1 Tax=Cohnella thailandensis TaxID=557557 RepID=A0A841T0G7_9BACL|nr:DUF2961 domain-containing protein [Cohnella thailandensis]MBB6635898.1 DUF2961 domain-containing protein [Cohnella thailandensis]MBP1976276.1 hypothetical protein [Cohnella thailandensis]
MSDNQTSSSEDRSVQRQSDLRGLANLERFDLLPLLRDGVQVRYEGSIDKQGYNADWDWWLYREGDEWVIFDVDGPGCIYNFVQHRYPESAEPTFRFYFDGEKEPRFAIKPSEFGTKPPFLSPLADAYLGPEDNGRGPIRVVRSFVPMPYAKSCRITSDLRLKGAGKGDGGWGHVVYHSYSDAEGVRTFTGAESYERVLNMWSRVGEDPKPAKPAEAELRSELTIEPGETKVVLDARGAGSVAAVLAEPDSGGDESWLRELWIRATWDDHSKPDVECPAGLFFANELGYNPVGVLSHGRRPDGSCYHYFPMPFWRSARIELVNQGTAPVRFARWETRYTASDPHTYPEGRAGYFRSSAYYEPKATPGADSVIGRIEGRGHLVAGHVTARARKPGVISCEGDVRVLIDGIATPQVESDGSESWACYGWGFPTPPESNPSSAYDGLPDNPWSMVRLCGGDWYPFRKELVFGIESGEFNNQYLRHSGILFYYGIDEPGLLLTDELDIGDKASEGVHVYRSTGSRGHYEVESEYEDGTGRVFRDKGHETEGDSRFVVSVDPRNRGVRLRRRSDQIAGRQRANVYVDGVLVAERSWYFADRNPYKRWLEDEFEIPASYTAGKTDIEVRLEYVQEGETRAWNEFRYWIYSII